MAFSAASFLTRQDTTSRKEETPSIPSNLKDLTVSELETLLSLIKNASFYGRDIEMVYNIVVKLQNQYLEQTK